MEYNLEQKKVIYCAVRQYQMNQVSLNGKKYKICDEILKSLFFDIKSIYIEPAYEVSDEFIENDAHTL